MDVRTHWIVERARRDEDSDPALALATGRMAGRDDVARMVAALRAGDRAVEVVRKPPFADFLVAMDSDAVVDLPIAGPCFAYGSTTLELVAGRMGWTPGFLDGPGMLECVSAWGGAMLNASAEVHEIGAMPIPPGPVFIRPETDGKAFAGTVKDPVEFEEWRAAILDIDGWTNVPPTLRVLAAPPVRIRAEWRLWISLGRVATASLYRDGSRLRTETGAPADVLAYAAARADEWSPRAAYVMDVAETDDGLRIVETNSISSAGLYAADVDAWIDGVEAAVAHLTSGAA